MNSLDIVFPQAGVVALCEREVADPAGSEILCQMEWSLVSTGTESFCLQGQSDPGTNWSTFIRYPFDPGYCAVAQVIAIGPEVDSIRVGDRITALVSHRQRFVIDQASAIRIPDGVSSADAAWATLACVTQLGIRRAAHQLGEAAGVIGLGVLGQLVVQYLALAGARQIIAIDPSQPRLALAARHGATATLAMDVAHARAAVVAANAGVLLDVAYDVSGNPAVLSSATQLVRPLGRVILLGDTPTPSLQQIGPRVVADSISIMGIHGTMHPAQASAYAPWTFRAMADLFFTYLMQGRMQVADLVTQRCDPREAPALYAKLLADRLAIGGVLFDWSALS